MRKNLRSSVWVLAVLGLLCLLALPGCRQAGCVTVHAAGPGFVLVAVTGNEATQDAAKTVDARAALEAQADGNTLTPASPLQP